MGVSMGVSYNITRLPLNPVKHTGYIVLSDMESLTTIDFHNEAVWLIKAPSESPLWNVQLNSRVYMFTEAGLDMLKFTEIYQVADHLPVITNDLGTWKLNQGISMVDQFIWERRRNLTGLVLELTTGDVRH
jgi:hypothetical protein